MHRSRSAHAWILTQRAEAATVARYRGHGTQRACANSNMQFSREHTRNPPSTSPRAAIVRRLTPPITDGRPVSPATHARPLADIASRKHEIPAPPREVPPVAPRARPVKPTARVAAASGSKIQTSTRRSVPGVRTRGALQGNSIR